MKILVFADKAAARGGLEIFAERRAEALRADGHEVETAREAPADLSAWDRIEVHKCLDPAALERFPPEKTVVWVHDHEPVCPRRHAYTPLLRNCSRASGLWPCLFCAPFCRHPVAALGRVFSLRRRLRAMRRFARVVALSGFMKDRLVASGIPAAKIEVRPPEIRLPEPSGPLPEGVDLLYVGQLTRGKGVQTLLRAMALADARHTLDVVGSGNHERRLRALARRLGLAGRVRFRGWSDDPRAWMLAARCVVVPSVWQEPYGLVAAEAVALGRPVVASDVGGLPEACGGKAALVPPGDAAALARALDAVRGA